MKKILLLTLAIFGHFLSKSQALYPYAFSSSTAAYQNLSGSTHLFQGIKWDDTIAYIPLGFPFKWAYDNYTTDSVWLDTYGMLHVKPDSIIIWGFPSSSITGYWADLCDITFQNPNTSLPARSDISYLTTGNAGSRIFKVEFKNCGFYNDTVAMMDSANFQIWLYEGTNVIEYHYGRQDIQDNQLAFDATGPHIGLEYKTTMDINNSIYTIDSFSNVSGTNTAFSDAFYTTPVDPFNNNFPNSYFMMSVPDSGQVFRYTPQSTSGIHENTLFKQTIVYPSSFTNSLYIQSDVEAFDMMLMNTGGDIILQSKGNKAGKHSLNTETLSSGVYMIRLSKGDHVESFKVVKR